jgi:hypothetical protein
MLPYIADVSFISFYFVFFFLKWCVGGFVVGDWFMVELVSLGPFGLDQSRPVGSDLVHWFLVLL